MHNISRIREIFSSKMNDFGEFNIQRAFAGMYILYGCTYFRVSCSRSRMMISQYGYNFYGNRPSSVCVCGSKINLNCPFSYLHTAEQQL